MYTYSKFFINMVTCAGVSVSAEPIARIAVALEASKGVGTSLRTRILITVHTLVNVCIETKDKTQMAYMYVTHY